MVSGEGGWCGSRGQRKCAHCQVRGTEWDVKLNLLWTQHVETDCRGYPWKGDKWRRMKRKQSVSDITDGDLGSRKSRTSSWNGGIHQIHPDSAQRTNTALEGYGWAPALGSEMVRTNTMVRGPRNWGEMYSRNGAQGDSQRKAKPATSLSQEHP